MLHNFHAILSNEYEKLNSSNVSQMAKILEEKPLFAMIFTLGMNYVYPISFATNLSYFIYINLNSDKLFKLLDTFPIECFKCSSSSQSLLYFIILHQTIFFITFAPVFAVILPKVSWYNLALMYIAMHTVKTNCNIPYILIHYYQYSTCQSLEKIVINLKTLLKNENG